MNFNDLGITSDQQLVDLAKKMGLKVNYIGFAEDMKKLPKDGLSIINLGDDNMGGSHWTMLWVEPDKITYFDSYGVGPENNIIKLAGDRQVIFNKKQVQRYEEEHCGVWVLCAAAAIANKKNKPQALEEYIDQFKQV